MSVQLLFMDTEMFVQFLQPIFSIPWIEKTQNKSVLRRTDTELMAMIKSRQMIFSGML